MIDFEQKLQALDNKTPLSDSEGEVSLKRVCTAALLGSYPDEKELAGTEKVARFRLAVRIESGSDKFSAEEISLIKKLVAKAYVPLVVGRAWELLDPTGP